MAELPLTGQAMFELSTEYGRRIGSHMGSQLSFEENGVFAGEEPFDPNKHPVSAIDPMSFGEVVFGVPFVSQVVPYRPVDISVVLHQDPRLRVLPDYLQGIREYKRELATKLFKSIFESKQMSDTLRLFIIGDTEGVTVDVPGEVKAVEDTKEPEAAANTIGTICNNGLAIVISDFSDLPLEKLQGVNFNNTIAIKSNYELELALPANVGRLPAGVDGEVVNTNKPKELAKFNEGLVVLHDGIVNRLESAGITVARVIFERLLSSGFELRKTDEQIADAVHHVVRK